MNGISSALEIRDLSYSYRGDWLPSRHQALRGISISVKEGEAFGFLGHNGAGKTTTIKCILGLIRPSSGLIEIMGQSSRRTDSRRRVGYLPEQPYFYDHLSVRELVEFYAHLAGVSSGALRSAVRDALDKTGIGSRAASPLRSLSKGLIQRVALAQAIVAGPRLLILDEPFSGLDPIARKEFRDILADLKRQGVTIFMSSHILSDIESFCERAAILSQGSLQGIFEMREVPSLLDCRYELVTTGSVPIPPELKAAAETTVSETNFTRLIFNDREKAAAALRAGVTAGLEIQSFQMISGGLEELFLRKTRSVRTDAGYEG